MSTINCLIQLTTSSFNSLINSLTTPFSGTFHCRTPIKIYNVDNVLTVLEGMHLLQTFIMHCYVHYCNGISECTLIRQCASTSL